MVSVAQVMVQPFEVSYESDFFLNLLQLYEVLASFQFQHDRVNYFVPNVFLIFLFIFLDVSVLFFFNLLVLCGMNKR